MLFQAFFVFYQAKIYESNFRLAFWVHHHMSALFIFTPMRDIETLRVQHVLKRQKQTCRYILFCFLT